MNTPPLWLILLSASFFSYLTHAKALKYQRNRKFWALMGFCFGLWGFLAFYFTNSKKKHVKHPVEPAAMFPQLNLFQGAWYYSIDKEVLGPVSPKKINELYLLQIVTDQTLIWHENLDSWKQAQEFKA